MYIKKLILENFKIFEGTNEFTFSKGVNYLVGENNSGKTTVFNAVKFLTKKVSRDQYIYQKYIQDISKDVSVTLVLGDCTILPSKAKKYENYINCDEDNSLIIKKTSEVLEVNGKKTSIQNVLVLNQETNEYENPTGVPNTITALLDCLFIDANRHNEDIQDFSSTKLMGKLVSKVTADFQQTDEFKELEQKHKEVFGEKGIGQQLTEIEQKLSDTVKDQFGESEIKINFDFPKIKDLLKKGNIQVKEQGINTDISEKGNGLQRAVLLALIQISAEYDDNEANENILYFLDEPELFLHPRAQDKLLKSLNKLACNDNSQVFITTHSPYILKNYNMNNSRVYILDKDSEKIHYESMEDLVLPDVTVGEITYKAFKIPNVEFHHRLFSDIYGLWTEKVNKYRLTTIDEELFVGKYNLPTKKYIPKKRGQWKDEEDRSMPYIIRNCQDHPEVKERNSYSEEELKSSIESLVQIYKDLKSEVNEE